MNEHDEQYELDSAIDHLEQLQRQRQEVEMEIRRMNALIRCYEEWKAEGRM